MSTHLTRQQIDGHKPVSVFQQTRDKVWLRIRTTDYEGIEVECNVGRGVTSYFVPAWDAREWREQVIDLLSFQDREWRVVGPHHTTLTAPIATCSTFAEALMVAERHMGAKIQSRIVTEWS